MSNLKTRCRTERRNLWCLRAGRHTWDVRLPIMPSCRGNGRRSNECWTVKKLGTEPKQTLEPQNAWKLCSFTLLVIMRSFRRGLRRRRALRAHGTALERNVNGVLPQYQQKDWHQLLDSGCTSMRSRVGLSTTPLRGSPRLTTRGSTNNVVVGR